MATLSVFDFLKSVPNFDGKAEELPLFIKSIEEIRQYVEGTCLTLFDLKIIHKIVNKANIAPINNNSPTNWDEIKSILKANFCINESIESIINKMKISEMRETINDLYEHLITLLTKLNLRASIDNSNERYTCSNNEKIVLRIFINKLPSEAKLILNARNPDNLLKAKEILVETEYFYEKFNNGTKCQTQLQSFSSRYYENPINNNKHYNNYKRNHNHNQQQNFDNTRLYNNSNSGSPNTTFRRYENSDQSRNSQSTQTRFSNNFYSNNRQFQPNFTPNRNNPQSQFSNFLPSNINNEPTFNSNINV